MIPGNDPETARVRVGLSLGGGAARGFAHVGVLTVLEREGLRPSLVAGSSIGAVVGALFCSGRKADEIYELMLKQSPSMSSFLFTSFRPQPIEQRFRDTFGSRTFESLSVPLIVTITDVVSGKTLFVKEGPVADALVASTRIPIVFPPVIKDDRILVDGGLLCNLPVSILRESGADRVLAVDIGYIGLAEFERPQGKFQMACRCLDLLGRIPMHLEAEKADLVLSPKVLDDTALDFQKAEKFYKMGLEAAEANLDRIRTLWSPTQYHGHPCP
jgi:NTE family protein